MTDDLLAPFVRAYRDENPGTKLDTTAIRRRVIARVGSRERRRAVLVRVLLPIAATFFGSAALAASHGGFERLTDVKAWFRDETEAVPPAESRVRVHRHVAKVHALPGKANEPPPAPSSAPVEAPSAAVTLDELPVAKSAPGRKPHASANEQNEPASEPRNDALRHDIAVYEEAHRLHFHANDAASALAAWDTYLTRYPAGVFAPEARFNRAVCLLRLGRRSEAREVFVRIADAKAGAYGRERARAFLDAMGD